MTNTLIFFIFFSVFVVFRYRGTFWWKGAVGFCWLKLFTSVKAEHLSTYKMSGRFIPCKLQQNNEVLCYNHTDILHIVTCTLHSTRTRDTRRFTKSSPTSLGGAIACRRRPADKRATVSQKQFETTNLPLMSSLAHSDENNAACSPQIALGDQDWTAWQSFLWISIKYFYNRTLKLEQGFMRGSEKSKKNQRSSDWRSFFI